MGKIKIVIEDYDGHITRMGPLPILMSRNAIFVGQSGKIDQLIDMFVHESI